MIRCIALDDEPPALTVLQRYAERVDILQLDGTFTRPSEAQQYLKDQAVDLMFLDIQMPSISGIDFYTSLNKPIPVIFTTAFTDYAVQGFNLNAVDYLLKPYSFERFQQAVRKFSERQQRGNTPVAAEEPFLLIKADYRLVKVKMKDIEFIEGLDNYLKIHLLEQKTIVTRMTMKSMIEKLPADQFIRVHRSFIVPLSRIESVRSKMIRIGKEDIPIGNSYEEGFFRVFKG
jgi:DNA-binding LytR/AlgR family response regulator